MCMYVHRLFAILNRNSVCCMATVPPSILQTDQSGDPGGGRLHCLRLDPVDADGSECSVTGAGDTSQQVNTLTTRSVHLLHYTLSLYTIRTYMYMLSVFTYVRTYI